MIRAACRHANRGARSTAGNIVQSRSGLEGERKRGTVLFADVKGSLEPTSQLDPEQWHYILERFPRS